MSVSAVVVSHGHAAELERSLPALAPQVDELVVIANLPGSVGGTSRRAPACSRTGRRSRSPPTSTWASRRRAASTSWSRTRTRSPSRARSRHSPPSRTSTRGPASSARSSSGRTAPGSRRCAAFPTVLGTLARRTPVRLLRNPYEHQTSHYGTRPDEPVQGDWLLGGACLLMRRTMLDEIGGWDRRLPPLRGGHRRRLPRGAGPGWERWLVPTAVVRHDYAAVIDKRFLSRHTLWHLSGMLRFVRKHPERLRALR